ncbi:MAG: ATP-binding protein [Candidatus Electryoneaceae bacterium]|nr:ATP-binding protein [Candidatus Electryoneaceae bacterium]
MKELVVISGKGGTGKTSIVASFAALAKQSVLADCDVDAADLHLILDPKVNQSEEYFGGKVATINPELCLGCGICAETCRFDAIKEPDDAVHHGGLTAGVNTSYTVDPIACEGCGVCEYVCPVNAVDLIDRKAGDWFISETRFGPMVHAKLGIAAENSGKLVAMVKTNASRIASERGLDLVIVDGSPGIGCPVISSITGADLVLIVTEPTMSGQHDLARVADLTAHFKIPTAVCVNKWDINADVFNDVRGWCDERGLDMVGKIDYDKCVTEAQIAGQSIIEFGNGEVSSEIRRIWDRIREKLQ